MHLILYLLIILLTLYVIHNRGRGYTSQSAPWDPPVIVENVITRDECAQVINLATPSFQRSKVVGQDDPSSVRTSDTAWISKSDPIAQKILARASELTGKPLSHCEDLQVVRYTPGTYYREHHDSCCESDTSCTKFSENGGQRVGTLLVYLNDDFKEGETNFPMTQQKLKTEPGSAIFFRPLGRDDNRCHPNALHAGLPVTDGVKYVCNAWVREKPLQ